ncbi:MAG: hypothetical protein J1E64_05610 [Acetatifactor sp.]|nr:hypothetical protein [Acetatifactor sp.]
MHKCHSFYVETEEVAHKDKLADTARACHGGQGRAVKPDVVDEEGESEE